jgi:hypothetical protein
MPRACKPLRKTGLEQIAAKMGARRFRQGAACACHRIGPARGRDRFDSPAIDRISDSGRNHEIHKDNVWQCVLGWDLVREAREILAYPRMYPACIHADMSLEELKEYLIVERVGVPLRHQMSGRELKALANSFVAVIARNINLFVRLRVDQWARIMGRELRWLRYRKAEAKASVGYDS